MVDARVEYPGTGGTVTGVKSELAATKATRVDSVFFFNFVSFPTEFELLTSLATPLERERSLKYADQNRTCYERPPPQFP